VSARTNGTARKVVRCAIYTRKSTDEGLSMEFNSLDAQREAAEAFIKSQTHEGWVCLPDRYDDGGFSGGNMERPALRRLLADVEARKLDCIVVYKVDRLSRSLLDFSRMMESLDRAGVSFVSVTQQFNTTHSMGRLTLNILLSFAQFEREIISERTKDKMSAARRKGKWVGGSLILGYDLNAERTRLVVNQIESQRVQAIFHLYLKTQSLLATAEELNRRGWQRKTWTSKEGKTTGGGKWNKVNTVALLTNMAYIGKVKYDGQVYSGEQPAIIDEATWAKTQALLQRNRRERGARQRNKYGGLLRGLVCCGTCGVKMIHTYTDKGGMRYRYYVCQTAMKQGWNQCETRSIPAVELEQFVLDRLAAIGADDRLAKEVAARAEAEHAQQTAALVAERRGIETNMREAAKMVAGLFGQPNTVARLADLQDQIRAGENRLTEIAQELAALGGGDIDKGDVTSAMQSFHAVWEKLSPKEQARMFELLIERIVYDKTKGAIEITLRPDGIKDLNQQAA
jgi:site-specific DNA recombinase